MSITPLDIIFAAYIASVMVQILFWTIRFAFKDQSMQPHSRQTLPPVSVIICAKDEYQNIKKNLPLVLKQFYPEFEVILGDDFSSDQTKTFVLSLQKDHKNLKYLHASEDKVGKKLMLRQSINSSRYNTILVTDADCRPNSQQWISKIMTQLSNEKNVVLGYGPHEKLPGMLNKFIRYETAFTAIQYFSAALKKQPYMGVGRNMAFRKDLYQNQEFSKHENIASGDDDLFINKMNHLVNASVCLSEDSHMISSPKTTLSSYISQKRRHISTSVHYNLWSQFLLFIYPKSLVILYFILPVLLFSKIWLPVLIMFLLRQFVFWFFVSRWLKKLDEKDLLSRIFLLDILLSIYYLVMLPFLFISNKTKW